MVKVMNPALGFFAGLIQGLLGNPSEAGLQKTNLAIVKTMISGALMTERAKIMSNEMKAIGEELDWVPDLLRQENSRVKLTASSYPTF